MEKIDGTVLKENTTAWSVSAPNVCTYPTLPRHDIGLGFSVDYRLLELQGFKNGIKFDTE